MTLTPQKRKPNIDLPPGLPKKRRSPSIDSSTIPQPVKGNLKEADRIKVIELQLKTAIDLYDNYRFDKGNVWSTNAIDLFHSFVTQQARVDYRFVGQSLAAITKIYVLRLDSLYGDAIRLGSSIGRQNKATRVREDNEILRPCHEQKPLKKILKRKTNIVKNVAAINSRLLTHPQADPFFAKMNYSVSDLSRSNKMLLEVYSSSSLLSTRSLCWNKENQYELPLASIISFSGPRAFSVRNSTVRVSLADYKLSQETLDVTDPIVGICSDEDQIWNASKRFKRTLSFESGYNTQTFRNSFEFNDESQANRLSTNVTVGDAFKDCAPPLEQPENDRSCIEDMEPQDPQTFEYSFRAADLVANSYFGPSHWKFLKRPNRNRGRIVKRYKKLIKIMTLKEVKEFCSIDLQRKLFSNRRARTRLIKSAGCTLPYDYKVSESIYEGFLNCRLNWNDPIVHDCEIERHEDVNEPVDEDTDYCSSQSQNWLPQPKASNKPRISMRKMSMLSQSIIEREFQRGKRQVKFSEIYSKIDKMCKKATESSSCALTFLGLLTAACEAAISLVPGQSINDFTVQNVE